MASKKDKDLIALIQRKLDAVRHAEIFYFYIMKDDDRSLKFCTRGSDNNVSLTAWTSEVEAIKYLAKNNIPGEGWEGKLVPASQKKLFEIILDFKFNDVCFDPNPDNPKEVMITTKPSTDKFNYNKN
jgi:hypothetical protein